MKKTLGDLKPNPENPRRITDEKLEQLKRSLAEFGDLSGFIYNQRTDRFVGGHQRQKALPPNSEIKITQTYTPATKSGTTAIGEVIVNDEIFTYRVVDWDEAKEMAANIAANKGGGEWDFPKLTDWMNKLDAMNFDMDLTMFDASERDRLLGGWETDFNKLDKIEENLDGLMAKITIECTQDDKDAVLIYIKEKLLETAFEGVHVK